MINFFCLTIIRWQFLFLDAYPWQISFQLKQLGRFSHICGGSVIDEHTVVCAAHCVVGQVEEQVQVAFHSYLYLPQLFRYIKLYATYFFVSNHYWSNILFQIVAGAHNIAKDVDNSWQIRKIAKLLAHEDYDSYDITNDISLIKLSEPLQLNEFVQPVKLAASGEMVEGKDTYHIRYYHKNAFSYIKNSNSCILTL